MTCNLAFLRDLVALFTRPLVNYRIINLKISTPYGYKELPANLGRFLS